MTCVTFSPARENVSRHFQKTRTQLILFTLHYMISCMYIAIHETSCICLNYSTILYHVCIMLYMKHHVRHRWTTASDLTYGRMYFSDTSGKET